VDGSGGKEDVADGHGNWVIGQLVIGNWVIDRNRLVIGGILADFGWM
jgi:hypothetical protein